MVYSLQFIVIGGDTVDKRFIAERHKNAPAGLALNTEAMLKYKDDIIELSIGDTDFTTDERIIEAAFEDARRGYTHYGFPKGDPELIDAYIRAWKEDHGQDLDPESVTVSASSMMGMQTALLAMLDPGDEVIIFSPYFTPYASQIKNAGGVPVIVSTYASENFDIPRERLEEAITPRTKAVIFNNPCNPTGRFYPLSTRQMLADIAKEKDLVIIADEIYTSFVYEGEFVPMRTLEGMEERTITLNSFSKNFLMTGWRIGMIISDPAFAAVIKNINTDYIYTAPSISQRAAIKALEIREDIKKTYISKYRERVEYSSKRLEAIPYLSLVPPGGTFYIFPGIQKTGLTSAEFTDQLLERAHILVTPGTAFGPAGEGHFRISCTVPKYKLKEALDRMEKLSF